jgi:AraC-like DNA-binding protein
MPAYANSIRPEETLRIWRPAHLESLELHLGTSFHHSFPPHWHEDCFLSAITAGAGHFYYRGRDHVATPGTLVLVAPGEVHTHHDHEGGRSFRALSLPISTVAELAREVTQGADPLAAAASNIFSNGRLVRLFLALHQVLEGSGNRLQRDALLLRFFAELIPHATKQRFPVTLAGREHRAVSRARHFLDENYNREVSLKELSAVANLSANHLHGVFCRQIGLPPHAYQIRLRIMHAAALLRKDWPIVHVAAATGFADQSHFTKHFKRLEGLTPAQYRGK